MKAKAALALTAGALALTSTPAQAAPPQIVESWVTDVTATGANLRASIKPNGPSSTYRVEYVTQAAYEASGFAAAAKAPVSGQAPLGSGTSALAVVQHVGGLVPATAYRFRAVATNADDVATGPERIFATQESTATFGLPDDRGWELVSPADKGGGSIAAPGALFGGGHFQAAAAGGALTYSSASAFGSPQGAPPASQYLARRTAAGWSSENLSPPTASGAYGDDPDGAPYRLFSADLGRGLLSGGLACRGGLAGCPAPTPVIPGSGAPPGHMAYYLRDNASGSFASLLAPADLAHTSVSHEAFEASFAAASPDLAHIVLASCAALSVNATEVPDGPGRCDADAQNLYLRSAAGLALLNLLPGDGTGTPGAQIAAPIGAVSADGSRVYWTLDGNLYLRDGGQSFWVDEAVGGGGAFQTISADGSLAFFTKAGHVHRFAAASKAVIDLTPAGGVVGVLGASANGAYLYYQDAVGLKQWHEGATTTIAAGPAVAPSNHPPASGTARISASGEHLAFLSSQELAAFDNAGQMEAYLYGPAPAGGAARLICASCNPTGERSQGPASLPGALVNGSTAAYKPRALAAGGNRLFFESADKLVVGDTNSHPDVYQWEADGVGDCQRSPGCVRLISSGRATEGASFVDASEDGSDVYFLTDESLVAEDPGSIDLYDARIGGGFPAVLKPIACIADACQSLPAPPDDPSPGTLTPNAGNPSPRYFGPKKKSKRKKRGQRQRGRGAGKQARRGSGHR